MDTAPLKRYAPAARTAFLSAVSLQAATLGITAKGSEPATSEGDVVLIAGRAFPKAVLEPRRQLEKRISEEGFEATMDAAAYTWFNRLVAIRYMELHGYLEHGYRVLSHPEGLGRPELLDHAAEVELVGLDRARAIELKLAGTKDEELYRLLLIAQCNALHTAMPFLFEPIGGESELLLPANLLHSDSLVRTLVESIDEEAWDEIEIIGWIYQFYISEKKDQVIGKVVRSEDIPAATQLFTPNWIVQYMVQNSLGAQWLATYPDSPLRASMAYYIEPAEQSPEVQAQLDAITPASLDPEAITLIDPACGSGHILVEAYELFKAIYLERGYRRRDVPRLILEHNLFGLDIDERAAQLTGFALMMKGRADDRKLFERGLKLQVLALQDSGEWTVDNETLAGGDPELAQSIGELKELFEHATTFGSLIQVPEDLAAKLPALKLCSEAKSEEELFVLEGQKRLEVLVHQAELLATQYDAVVANPPYMGSKGMNTLVKKFARENFFDAKNDLFACFMERGYTLARDKGYNAMVTMQSWMFLSSYEKMRERILREKTIQTMAHLGARAFGSISGEVVQTTACVLRNRAPRGCKSVFFRLLEGNESEKQRALSSNQYRFEAAQDDFKKIPGSPVAYWVSLDILNLFSRESSLSTFMDLKAGMSTGANDIYQRQWYEIDFDEISFSYLKEARRWVPCNSGGSYRKWYGNNVMVVDWGNSGERIKKHRNSKGVIGSAVRNESFYFLPGLTWSKISSSRFAARWSDAGFAFDDTGRTGFATQKTTEPAAILAVMISNISQLALDVLTPTLSVTSGELAKLPIPGANDSNLVRGAVNAIALTRKDWDLFETSWDYIDSPLVSNNNNSLEADVDHYTREANANRHKLQQIEIHNNHIINDVANVTSASPDVPIEQITLTVNPAYRYGTKIGEEEQWTRFRQDTMQELVSYAIGCMMGRYSLDEPGLIYAHSGNTDFDPSRYSSFPADEDGIVPLTDTHWFDDDACLRLVEFIEVAWDKAQLEDNLRFLAQNLSPKESESSRDTLRSYLNTRFFKDHLKTYKKRPIYWLFSSGKHKAFQALVYLHRYNEGTLSRMRSEYVIPLQGKFAARLEKLSADILVASSSAEGKRLRKEKNKLEKQQIELLNFDETLRHYADRRVALDLDDGVKVNYGKFGGLLAEVKAIHGKKPEEG